MQIDELVEFIKTLDYSSVSPLLDAIVLNLNNLMAIGLGYLTLGKWSPKFRQLADMLNPYHICNQNSNPIIMSRSSNFVSVFKAKVAITVVRLLKETKMPVRTITTDNGTEFAAHEIIAKELNTSVYFAHPYSPWEKGAIENMNGLVRQYIPKKADFKGISSGYIKHIIQKLNNRPRKKNDFAKPIDIIKQ